MHVQDIGVLPREPCSSRQSPISWCKYPNFPGTTHKAALLKQPRDAIGRHSLSHRRIRKMENCIATTTYPIPGNRMRPRRGQRRGALSHMVAANLRARALATVIRDVWAEGFMSYNAVARELNRRGVPTLRNGKQWYPMTAGRVLVRMERAGLIRIRRPSARGSLLQLASRE